MSTISCVLMGGLGNQLFQIFTTIAYGMKYKRNIVFPYSETLNYGITRNTYWNSFLHSLKNMTTISPNSLHNNEQLVAFPQYREYGHHYTEIPNVDINEMSLFGYFQSPRYFEYEKRNIYRLMKLSESKRKIKVEYPEYFIDGSTVISMHFRLGDYKTNQNSHPLMPYTYYDNSLIHMLLNCKLDDSVTVLYFCEKEDNSEVLQMITKLSKMYSGFTFVKVDDTIEDWKQLMLMSLCDHNIIANSSFSWWGAYFNENDNKIVCYPSVWFGPSLAQKDVSDMTPPEWNKILVR
jgi:hypothetical protein